MQVAVAVTGKILRKGDLIGVVVVVLFGVNIVEGSSGFCVAEVHDNVSGFGFWVERHPARSYDVSVDRCLVFEVDVYLRPLLDLFGQGNPVQRPDPYRV